MADVFISYSRKNSVFARRLIDRLILDSKDAWVDWEGIPLTSPNWWGEIKAGIEGADNFVFIISPDSTASVVCNMELDYAIELKKRIVPVVYQDVQTRDAFASIADYIPDEAMTERLAGKDPLIIARENWRRLSDINWVFLRESDDFDTAYERLITTVETDLEYVKAHTRYLVRATEWQRESQREDLLLFGGEIDRAEAWLQKAEGYTARAQTDAANKVSNPLPKDLHHTYIRTSREQDTHRRRELRNLRIGRLSFAAVGVLAVIVALISLVSLNDTQRRADAANAQVATATRQVATAAAVQSTAESNAAIANTQVAFAEATVTQAAVVQQIASGFSDALLNQSRNPSQQIAAMDALVQRYPNESQVYHSRALVHAEQGNFILAIEDYTQAIGLNPSDATAFSNRGNTRSDSGDFAGAIADYTVAILMKPNDAFAYNNRGNARRESGDLEGAIADYTEAIRLDPNFAGAYNNRGVARRNVKDLEGAIGDFDEAIRIDPNFDNAYNNRGLARYDLGDFEGAIADYTEAIRLNSNSAEVYNNRGNALYILGDLEGAIEDYTESIRLDPNYAIAYYNRGIAFNDSYKFMDAIEDYTQTIHIQPSFVFAHNNRGVSRHASGDPIGAIADFTKAIELDENYANPYWGRGNVYYSLNRYAEAAADYRRYEAISGRLEPFMVERLAQIEAELGGTSTPAP